MKTAVSILPFLLILCVCSGCASGFVRYKTMGDWKYATVELPKRASSGPGKAFATAGGLIIDTPVLIADTCITPVVSLVPALAGPPALLMGADDDPFLILTPVFYPWYLCSFGGYGGDEGRDLRGFFGDESQRFNRYAPTTDSTLSTEGAPSVEK